MCYIKDGANCLHYFWLFLSPTPSFSAHSGNIMEVSGWCFPETLCLEGNRKKLQLKLLSREGSPLHFFRGGMKKTEENIFNLPHANEPNISSCLWGRVSWTLPIWKCHRTFQFHFINWRVWTATGIHRTLCLLPREILVVLGIGCSLESAPWLSSSSFYLKQEECTK